MNYVESATENLKTVFAYAFIETVAYHFAVPKEPEYLHLSIPRKIYHCNNCEKEIEIKFRNNGDVYASKPVRLQQVEIRRDLGLPCGSLKVDEVVDEHQIGYCQECFAKLQQEDRFIDTQKIYDNANSLLTLDCQLPIDAKKAMDEAIRTWVDSFQSLEDMKEYQVETYLDLRRLIVSKLLEAPNVKELLAKYQENVRAYKEKLAAQLAEVEHKKFLAHIAWPLNLYESMSTEWYNEYTVLFPEDQDDKREFYVNKAILKERVQMFLDQHRIDTVQELINEVGFFDEWIEMFVSKASTL